MIVYAKDNNDTKMNPSKIQTVIIADDKTYLNMSALDNKHHKLIFLRGVILSSDQITKLSELDCEYLFIDTCEGFQKDSRKIEEQIVKKCKKAQKIIFYGRKANFNINNPKALYFENEIEWVKNKEFEQIAKNYNTFCQIIETILLKYQTKVTPLTIEQLQDPSFEPMEVVSGHALLLFDKTTFHELRKIVKKSPSVVYVILRKMDLYVADDYVILLKEIFPNLNSIKTFRIE
jgi:hypothetical protein